MFLVAIKYFMNNHDHYFSIDFLEVTQQTINHMRHKVYSCEAS